MPVTVVIGAQFGGEGKGKVSYCLAKENNAFAAIRIGGSNSGHTVTDNSGKSFILRHLPTAAILPDVICILGAGTYLNVDILFDELSRTGLSQERLFIDPNAMIVSKTEQNLERNSSLRKNIGSTLSGTGAAVQQRIKRNFKAKLAKDEKSLRKFVKPVSPFLRGIIRE